MLNSLLVLHTAVGNNVCPDAYNPALLTRMNSYTQGHAHTFTAFLMHTLVTQLEPMRPDAHDPALLTRMYRTAARKSGAHPSVYDMMEALASLLLEEVRFLCA